MVLGDGGTVSFTLHCTCCATRGTACRARPLVLAAARRNQRRDLVGDSYWTWGALGLWHVRNARVKCPFEGLNVCAVVRAIRFLLAPRTGYRAFQPPDEMQ